MLSVVCSSIICILNNPSKILEAVSYTHLDVYKRQTSYHVWKAVRRLYGLIRDGEEDDNDDDCIQKLDRQCLCVFKIKVILLWFVKTDFSR